MPRAWVGLVLLGGAGCAQVFGLSEPAHADDGGLSNEGAFLDARVCFGANAYTVCLASPPTTAVVFGVTAALDTTTSAACLAAQPAGWIEAGQPASCFIIGTSIMINARVDVDGTRPLVLVADTIAINGTLDVASHRSGKVGPGAPSSSCPPFPSTPASNVDGGGGGAGGSFMTRAGDGGDGLGNNTGGTSLAAEAVAPTVLRAGCAGQNGGAGQNLGGGVRGAGGGAVYIVAGTQITFGVGALINASGAGASAPGREAGGGGGGSGGMIVLHAPSITGTDASLMANGGGGSSGGIDFVGGLGDPGNDPSSPLQQAAGGATTAPAGDGGKGFASPLPATSGGNGGTNGGGGGGGGAAGFIASNVAPLAVTASPQVTIIQ